MSILIALIVLIVEPRIIINRAIVERPVSPLGSLVSARQSDHFKRPDRHFLSCIDDIKELLNIFSSAISDIFNACRDKKNRPSSNKAGFAIQLPGYPAHPASKATRSDTRIKTSCSRWFVNAAPCVNSLLFQNNNNNFFG